MFLQVIQGRCSRPEELRAWTDNWKQELGPGATGWLGDTFGFTDDGLFIGTVRFASAADAAANSARPEQGAWAERLVSFIDGPLEFRDYEDVTVLFDGGSDDAGFVQIIQGRVNDVATTKAQLFADVEGLREQRPEIIGATIGFAPDGDFTQTVAFTDEASARAGEAREAPQEIQEAIQAMMAGARFHDLRDPWFDSP